MSTKNLRKRELHVCMRCGAKDVHARYYADSVDFKGLTFDVEGLVESECGKCQLAWTTQGQDLDNLARIRAAFAQRRDLVRERDGLLSGEEIEYVLEQLGLSRSRAATLFGGGPNAFSKYIHGEVLQSVAMDRLLRLALSFGTDAVRVLEQGRNAPLKLNASSHFVAISTWSSPKEPPLQVPAMAGAGAATVKRGWAAQTGLMQ